MPEDRPFVDFKSIKRRVAIADVLARYEVNLVRVNEVALKGNCPLPSHSSGSKNTFYANETKSVWYCHSDSCKKNGERAGGNVIDFVTAMEGCSVYLAAKWLEEWFPAGPETTGRAAEQNGIARFDGRTLWDGADQGGTVASNKPLGFTLKGVNPEHPMIQERGISAETARQFGVGFFSGKGCMANRIVFPLYEISHSGSNCAKQAVLVGYGGRTTLPPSDVNPKWLFGKGLRKTFLYGLEQCDPALRLILCESLWGPLWFCEHGAQAAALMGSEMSAEQERSLSSFPVITVALDNDPPGVEKAAGIIERLKSKHHVLKARLIG